MPGRSFYLSCRAVQANSEVFLAAQLGEVKALQKEKELDATQEAGRLAESRDKIIVLKFGSSVLRTRADLPNAVHEVYRWYRSGFEVVAVVSAIGLTTDERLAEAQGLAEAPEPYATAELLATGERTSAALLAIVLDRAGIPARVLNPREIGLTAEGSPLDSELRAVDVQRVRELLAGHPVLIVPGFFGTCVGGRTHLLGRGGSDLTAVFVARALGARCRLIKDVDGVYETDPASASSLQAMPAERSFPARARGASQSWHAAIPLASAQSWPARFVALDYARALEVAAPLIQPKAVEFLRLHRGCAEVAASARDYETTVNAGQTELEKGVGAETLDPLRVLLLGLGTVGSGVYERLVANPERFKVIGALVRHRGKYEGAGFPSALLRTRREELAELRPHIVVDALPEAEIEGELVRHFLASAVPVVSAGKALIAKEGVALAALAERAGTALRYSAAVGGGSPMIEVVDRVAANGPILAFAGVLNGTCNFVLDRIGRSRTATRSASEVLAEALATARRAGFAETDASDDLSGADAARKLRILCRHAFGEDPTVLEFAALDEAVAERARQARYTGRVLRQLARASRCDGEVRATVRFEEVPKDSPFGRLGDEWNALQILAADGALRTVRGRGAGRWPTAEALMGDLLDIYRALSARRVHFCSPNALSRYQRG